MGKLFWVHQSPWTCINIYLYIFTTVSCQPDLFSPGGSTHVHSIFLFIYVYLYIFIHECVCVYVCGGIPCAMCQKQSPYVSNWAAAGIDSWEAWRNTKVYIYSIISLQNSSWQKGGREQWGWNASLFLTHTLSCVAAAEYNQRQETWSESRGVWARGAAAAD